MSVGRVSVRTEIHEAIRVEAERRGISMFDLVELALADSEVGQGREATVRWLAARARKLRLRRPPRRRGSFSVSARMYAVMRKAADERSLTMGELVEAAIADVIGAPATTLTERPARG